MKALLFGVLALLMASPLAAQVGHPPASSPYSDLEYKQEITPLFGYLRASVDPARTAPQSATMIGLRYELYLGGPVSLSSDLSRSFSTRTVIDPSQRAGARAVGTEDSPVNSLDLAVALSLTGRKSWHRIVPQIRGGVGVLQSSAKDSVSGYAFGTPFAFVAGGGLKFVPGGRLQLRADVTDRIFKLKYPDSYYRPASDNTSVLSAGTARSSYTHHIGLTVGVSYLFAR